MRKNSKKNDILEAAFNVIENESATSLTLERVAEVAGISKGGLLYHYPTKDELYKGMIEKLIELYDLEVENYFNKNPDGNIIEASINANNNKKIIKASKGLVAVLTYDPKLIDPLRLAYLKWDKFLVQSLKNEEDAYLFRFVLDGLFYAAILDLPMPKKSIMNKVFAKMQNELK